MWIPEPFLYLYYKIVKWSFETTIDKEYPDWICEPKGRIQCILQKTGRLDGIKISVNYHFQLT